MDDSVEVRQLRADELDGYRTVRLAALLDSPEAFTATWEQERSMPEADWIVRVDGNASGHSAIIVADAGGAFVGTAGGIPHEDRIRVVGVWVAPEFRHRGLGQALVERVCAWAASAGYGEVQIETAVDNAGPRTLYERIGFVPSDETPPPGCGPVLVRALA